MPREGSAVGEAESGGSGHASGVKIRYARIRRRVDETTAGVVQRRIKELEVMNHALLLSALALTLFVPSLITLAAVVPLGSEFGLAASWARRLGLSEAAAHDVRHLFITDRTVAGGATVLSSLVTVLVAFGWPAELGRGYESIWGLESRGWRALWRPLVWLFAFFGVVAAVAASGAIASGLVGVLITGLLGMPLVLVWAWWTQHLLLGGRVAWRALLPGAVATAVGLLLLRLAMVLYLPRAIVSNYDRYGPIGVIFALLSWMVGFCVVMLGGPVVGHTWYQRRRAPTRPAAEGSTGTSAR
jgi:membrane protein